MTLKYNNINNHTTPNIITIGIHDKLSYNFPFNAVDQLNVSVVSFCYIYWDHDINGTID